MRATVEGAGRPHAVRARLALSPIIPPQSAAQLYDSWGVPWPVHARGAQWTLWRHRRASSDSRSNRLAHTAKAR